MNNKKKTLKIILLIGLVCMSCLFLCLITFSADSNWVKKSFNNQIKDSGELTTGACISTIEMNMSGFNASDYYWWFKYESPKPRYILYFIPKNYVLVRTVSGGNYYWSAYSYDGSKLVQQKFEMEAIINVGDTSCRVESYGSVSSAPSGDYSATYNGPYATSTSNALKYFQTMDATFLENASEFIEVPNPKNVSFYLADNENGGYVYYENEPFDIPSFNKSTRLIISYSYINASGERVDISQNELDIEWLTRNQVFIDFSPLETYDTGVVAVSVLNYVSNENSIYFCDSPVGVEHSLGTDYFTWFEYEGDTPIKKPIVDYGNKNPSYTGGVGGGSISPGIDSDYGFLDGIFNAFGLIGDNGLIRFMGELFSFIPTPVIVALSGFVFVAIIIALFKMFVK